MQSTQFQEGHDLYLLTNTGVQVHLRVSTGGGGTLCSGLSLLWGHLTHPAELAWVLLNCVHQSAYAGTQITTYERILPVFEFTFLPNPPPRVWLQMSLRLRFFDPQLKERPEQELFIEPDWLLHLRQLDGQIKVCVCFLLSVGHHASDTLFTRIALFLCRTSKLIIYFSNSRHDTK